MDLLSLLVVFALVGFCAYLVLTYVPMPAPIKQAGVVIIVILLVAFVIRMVLGGGPIIQIR